MIVIENLTRTPTVGKGLLECLLPHYCHYLQDLLLTGAKLHLPTTTLGRTLRSGLMTGSRHWWYDVQLLYCY